MIQKRAEESSRFKAQWNFCSDVFEPRLCNYDHLTFIADHQEVQSEGKSSLDTNDICQEEEEGNINRKTEHKEIFKFLLFP